MAEQTSTPPTAPKPETDPIATVSLNFTKKVEKQFAAEMGQKMAWTDLQRALAQHLFIKIDASLKTLEAKRFKNDVVPYTWENVNMTKLALDAVHRICLGLDALIKNHIHPIPYWNSKLQKYDLDLRIGYEGANYCRQRLAVDPPVDVVHHLIYETDEFTPYFKDRDNPIESYTFKVKNPLNRGKVVGGFGYICYSNPIKNKLIVVDLEDFAKSESCAGSKDFWGEGKSRKQMQLKTVIHRTSDKIPLDPTKVNASSWQAIQDSQLDAVEIEAEEEAAQNANQTVIDVPVITQTAASSVPMPTFTQEPEKVPVAAAGANGQMSLRAEEGPGY